MIKTKKKNRLPAIIILIILLISSFTVTASASECYPEYRELVGIYNGANPGDDMVEYGSMNNPPALNNDYTGSLRINSSMIKWFCLILIVLALIVIAMIVMLVPKKRK